MRKKSLWQKRNNHPKVFLAFPFPRVTKNDFGFALPPLWVFEQVEGTRMKSGPIMVWGRSFPSLLSLYVHITHSGHSFSLNISTFIYFNTLLLIDDF